MYVCSSTYKYTAHCALPTPFTAWYNCDPQQIKKKVAVNPFVTVAQTLSLTVGNIAEYDHQRACDEEWNYELLLLWQMPYKKIWNYFLKTQCPLQKQNYQCRVFFFKVRISSSFYLE